MNKLRKIIGSTKPIALLLLLLLLLNHSLPVLASKQSLTQDLAYDAKSRMKRYQIISSEQVNGSDIYVRIKKSDLEELDRQAFSSTSLLQRIRDLERLYKQIKDIIETISATIRFVKKTLNIDDSAIDDFLPGGSENEFEHISGVTMSPGFVEFKVTTTDSTQVFDDVLTTSILDLDIYYNKNLFTINHIEGDGVFGDEYKRVALPQKTSAAKDRIKLPLSDVLTNEVNFKVFLAPLNHETIEVGDKTRVGIRYFKRVPKNEDGERIPPLTYELAPESPDTIEVIVK